MSTKDNQALKAAFLEKFILHPDCATYVIPSTLVDATEQDATKDDLIIPGAKGFMFDIIVVRLDVTNKTKQNPSKIKIDVIFNDRDVTISSNRINVLDFKIEPCLEFLANPLTLKDELAKNPLRLRVKDDESILGYGSLEWPEKFLSGLIECTGEIIFSDETELKECDGTKTGTIQIIVRLQPKCEEYVEDYSPDGKCRNANKEIHPNDVLFVVGEDKNPCCCSQVGIIPPTDSDQFLNPKCLDLSNFRAVNSQTVNNTNILNTIDPACQQEFESITNRYQQLIDSVMGKKMPKQLCQEKLYTQEQFDFKQKPSDGNSDSFFKVPSRCQSDKGIFAGINIIEIPHKESSLNLLDIQPEVCRCCPLCKENMSFLPKLAACPNCCYKPIPYFIENPYDDKQTAIEILQENNVKTLDSDCKVTNVPTKCRCSSQYNSAKPCAHCRIKKLCQDIFQSKSPVPTQQYHNDTCEQKSSDISCTSSKDDRPFLSRVFSELRDLYDIKDFNRKEFEPNERCEKELNKEPIKHSKPQPRNKVIVQKRNKPEEQRQQKHHPKLRKHLLCAKRRLVKPAADKIVRSRLYDYRTVCHNHFTHAGHKTCLNGFAGRKNVPPNMGWLWNASSSGVHAKWKPGKIRKPIKVLMRYFLKDFPADTLLVSQYSYRKKNDTKDKKDSELLVQKPTLHISKQNGEYIITMRPLKDPENLKDAADPYENMKPIQFRIAKNPQLAEIRKLKQHLKDMGYKKCTCHKPIIYCYCRSFLDKKKLEYQCSQECRKRNLKSCIDTLILSDTSESEEEYDFGVTPPAGVIKPERLCKTNFVNTGTQYRESDWKPTPLFPKAPNKYMEMYQCAIGERKGKTKSGARGANTTVGIAKNIGGGDMRSGPRSGGTGGNKSGSSGGMAGGVSAKKVTAGVAINLSAKYGGRGHAVGRAPGGQIPAGQIPAGQIPAKGSRGLEGPGGRKPGEKNNVEKKKVDMMKYILKSNKKNKLSIEEAAIKRKEKMRLLRGVNPPLLCTVDRRAKPFDPCAPCVPCGDNRIC